MTLSLPTYESFRHEFLRFGDSKGGARLALLRAATAPSRIGTLTQGDVCLNLVRPQLLVHQCQAAS